MGLSRPTWRTIILFLLITNFALQAQEYTIVLKDEMKLVDLFNAGIRPINTRGLESGRCNFSADKITFVLPDGKKISTKKGIMWAIDILNNDYIAMMSFRENEYSENYMSLEECEQRLLEYAKTLEVSPQIIIDNMNLARNRERNYIDPFSLFKKHDNWRFYVGVRSSPSINPNKRFVISFTAGQRLSRKKRYDSRPLNQPLKSPPGYEDHSMTPEPIVHSAKDIARAKKRQLELQEKTERLREKVRKKYYKEKQNQQKTINNSHLQSPPPTETTPPKSKPNYLLYIFIAILILLGGWIFYKNRK